MGGGGEWEEVGGLAAGIVRRVRRPRLCVQSVRAVANRCVRAARRGDAYHGATIGGFTNLCTRLFRTAWPLSWARTMRYSRGVPSYKNVYGCTCIRMQK